MGRTLSLVSVVVFAVGVVTLSSLARRTRQTSTAEMPVNRPQPRVLPRPKIIPAFAYEAPFSLN
jgi:hypothetical protein